MNQLFYNAVIKYAGASDPTDPTKIDGWKDAMNVVAKVFYAVLYLGLIVCAFVILAKAIKLAVAKSSDERQEVKRGFISVFIAIGIIVSVRLLFLIASSIFWFDWALFF